MAPIGQAQYRNRQQGISLVGLIFTLAVLGMIGVLGMKVVPTFVEYRAILNAIKTAKSSGTTPLEIQKNFDNNADVTYITSISGKDLIIGAENGTLEVSFAYEKRIPLVGIASLLLEYSGSTAKNKARAVKPVE